jgi:uncharacterized membrane protein
VNPGAARRVRTVILSFLILGGVTSCCGNIYGSEHSLFSTVVLPVSVSESSLANEATSYYFYLSTTYFVCISVLKRSKANKSETRAHTMKSDDTSDNSKPGEVDFMVLLESTYFYVFGFTVGVTGF